MKLLTRWFKRWNRAPNDPVAAAIRSLPVNQDEFTGNDARAIFAAIRRGDIKLGESGAFIATSSVAVCVACPVQEGGQCPQCGTHWIIDELGNHVGYRAFPVGAVPAAAD